mmetsp:Transcript_28869/g.80730  ORF Transcript_28869/g.80730 Transcript_28869/m.80730 type:complete len:257 (+) Transcript_28869:89-859(+)|eukprot:CAMPEP_0119118988 /NCGR_PEP_ID=MMETSP1310-20130426/681_1 /TAXON_ID=464262 /ORGANISM="Genus nov. species nov., Strain RCC2339" /LENGTH=256 /DNA_ID=CAMNT_0007108397 /DNA_START=61 /DNA_END=831 /DNA_ORIENTATION=-
MDSGQSVSLLFRVYEIRKKLGIQSWIEAGLIVVLAYMALNFLLGFLAIGLPMNELAALLGMAFAIYQIHLLGSLTEKLEKFDKENKRLENSVNAFQEQNKELKHTADALAGEVEKFKGEVNRLSETVSSLESVRETIEAYAEKNNADLGSIIDSMNATLEAQREVVAEQKVVLGEQKQAAKMQARVLLNTIFNQTQFMDQSMGMSPSEFQAFMSMVPSQYKQDKSGIDFEHLDSDADGNINVGEFQAVVERLLAEE